MRNHHYRIVKPVRFFIFVLICVMAIVFAVYSLTSYNRAQATSFNTYVQVSVKENDSLWDIASEYTDKYSDVRDTIDDICEINGIGPEDIQPGDIVFVPVD